MSLKIFRGFSMLILQLLSAILLCMATLPAALTMINDWKHDEPMPEILEVRHSLATFMLVVFSVLAMANLFTVLYEMAA